jgi:hypothetical protein
MIGNEALLSDRWVRMSTDHGRSDADLIIDIVVVFVSMSSKQCGLQCQIQMLHDNSSVFVITRLTRLNNTG